MRISQFVIGSLLLLGGAVGAERLTDRAALPAPAVASAMVQAQPAAPQPDAAPAGPAEAPAEPAAPRSRAVGPDVARLQLELSEVTRRLNTGARAGVLVVSLERGDTLFSLNPDLPLAPASNMKLYSTAAALYYLGPDFRYSTYVLGTGDIQNGVLQGDLILYGTGDPSMSGRLLRGSVAPMRALADSLRARGIREIQGAVVGDGSYFDSEWFGRGWSPDNFGTWYSAPVGALSIAENVASITLRPGPQPGAPAQVSTTPATDGFHVINQTTTVAAGAPFVRFGHDPEGLVIRGRIGRGHPGVAQSIAIVDPTNYTTAVFRNILAEQGIQVRGGMRTIHSAEESPVTFANRAARNGDAEPHPRVLAIHLSPPLSELISVTNHISHNLFAEALMKTVGRVALGEGSFDAGSRAIRYFLECEAGVDTASLAIVDGSGLSPNNRVTARATIQLLDLMTRNEHWESYLNSLPQAGQRRPRGLNRMLGTPAVGDLRAKTGTIRSVSSLSGYVRSADGEMMAFSIITNNLPASTWAAKRMEDEIGSRVASFRRQDGRATPAPAATAPAEDAPAAASPASPAPAPRAEPRQPERAPAAQPQRQPQRATPPAAAGRTYQIRQGDTLDGIARRHGTTVAAIQRANPGINPSRIRPGQTIRLP
jgi:serine-type D-Ala-D-Ala carboxypeptidase/endopeptidase (penicillin-binding protein 4)